MSEAPDGLRVDERRLAAILAADVAGYSRLMGRNEEETVRELEAHQAVILPLIAKHGGAIINIAGDGIVAQFPSAVRAVECAVAIQKIMAERNFEIPAERRMLLRIGVNLGDIIHDGTRTYGDGINVAARLEPLAEPGGICISSTVRDAIFGKLGLPLRDIGEKSLKNITRPVHIYQIQPPGDARPPRLAGLSVSDNIVGSRRRSGLSSSSPPSLALGAWRFWPRETAHARLCAGHRGTAVRQHDRRRRALTVLGPASRAKFLGAGDIPVAPDGPGLGPAAQSSRAKQVARTGSQLCAGRRLAKSGNKSRFRAQLTDAASGRDRLVGQLRI